MCTLPLSFSLLFSSYPEQQIREDLTICVRRHRPDVVFTWHPEWQLDLQPGEGWDDLGFHPDHQAVGALAVATTLGPSAGDGYMFPSLARAGLKPFGVSQIFLWTLQGFSHYFNISNPNTVQAKIASLLAHRTQFPSEDAVSEDVRMLGSRAADMAGVSGPGGVQYAELFYRICIFSDCAIGPDETRRRLFV